MKKNLLLLVLALIGMGGFTACNNEDDLLVQEQANTKPVVIRATIGDVSRLALGEDDGTSTKVTWGTGDAFALKIGEQTYTFNWQEGNDFVYANDNGDFPATFATAGIITATYPATAAGDLSVQSGTKANVGNYMQMTAGLAVTAGQSTTDLNLNFEHQTSVVEITLENDQYANRKAVVELRTQAEAMYSTPTEDEQKVQFDGSGKLTVYFAVSPTDAEVSGWYIGLSLVLSGDTYYDTAPLSDLKLDASKMYKVSKGSSDLKMAYKIDDAAPNTVIAYNAIGLYKWAEMATEDLSVNLKLGDNITLPTEGIGEDSDGPVKGNWTPVGINNSNAYQGSIDGNNKIISNMYIVNKTNDATHQGFLGNSYEVTIKNITFDGAKIVVGKAGDAIGGGKYVGVISGASRGNFDNCHVTGSTLKCLANGSDSQIMGGLVGSLSPGEPGKITNSSFNGTIDGRSRVGGIVGELMSSIGFYNYFASVTNCTAQGTIEGIDVVGGIAGWSRGYIEECTNNAIVNGANSGGIVGVMDAYACTIGCTNNGEITGETYAGAYGTGGIVGQIFNSTTSAVDSEIYVIACRNLNANVTLTSSRKPGGIVGYQDRQLSGVYGSYTVKSTVDKSFSACVGVNPGSVTNGTNGVFDSATDTDLTAVAVTALNTSIETAFSAMNTTSPKSSYVSKGNYNTYKDYRWSWTSGSGIWPEFKAPVAP